MPLSRFLGRPQRETTTHVYDEDGRLLSATTEREPDWSDEDRGWVLALLAEQADACPGCGHPMSECRDPKTMGQWSVTTQTCWACLITDADREARSEDPKANRGVYVGTYRYKPGEV